MRFRLKFIIMGLTALFFSRVRIVFADLAPLNPKISPYLPPSPKVSSTPSLLLVGGLAISVSLIALLILLRKRR